MKTKILVFLITLFAIIFAWIALSLRNPLLDIQFAKGFPDARRVKLISLEAASKRQITSLVNNVRHDAGQWDELNVFISELEGKSFVVETKTRALRVKIRLPEGSYLLFSPDKRSAFIKFFEIKYNTVLSLGPDDYITGY